DQQARRTQTRRSNDPGTAIERSTCLDHVDRFRDRHTDLPALVSDRELEALLTGGVPDEESAGGTGVSALPGTGVPNTPCQSGTPSLEGPQNANLQAVAMLAAELYATTPPPSKRKFREAMREAMNERGLTGSWDVVDALFDREKALAEDGEVS
ncbi:hypothetical protein, partial [Streptomyces sp. NPDC055085]